MTRPLLVKQLRDLFAMLEIASFLCIWPIHNVFLFNLVVSHPLSKACAFMLFAFCIPCCIKLNLI